MTNSSKGNGFGVDFDTYWKEILDLIEPATRFFLPALHQQVDWSIDYISLEQELRNLYARKKGRVKRMKLSEIYLTLQCILSHCHQKKKKK